MAAPRIAQRHVGEVAEQTCRDAAALGANTPAASHKWSTRFHEASTVGPTRVADLINPASMLLPAANVIMQLSAPGVGYGVLESPVDSGNVYKHPFKRARTTGTYLAAATIGTDADRELIRAAVDTAHAQVRSTASSPVSYNAFDPKLQLWVAACLYRYYVDAHEFLYGPLDDAAADAVYRDARTAGHHAAGARGHVARRPRRLRRLLEALTRRPAHRPARARAPQGVAATGVPAVADARDRRAVQPVRDHRLSARTSSARMMALPWGAGPATPVRVADDARCDWPTGSSRGGPGWPAISCTCGTCGCAPASAGESCEPWAARTRK